MTAIDDLLRIKLDRAYSWGLSERDIAAMACYGSLNDENHWAAERNEGVEAAALLAWVVLVRSPKLDVLQVALMPWRLEMVVDGLLTMDELVGGLPISDNDGEAEAEGALRTPRELFREVRRSLVRWSGACLDEQVVQACLLNGNVALRCAEIEAAETVQRRGVCQRASRYWIDPLIRAAERWQGWAAGQHIERGRASSERCSYVGETPHETLGWRSFPASNDQHDEFIGEMMSEAVGIGTSC